MKKTLLLLLALSVLASCDETQRSKQSDTNDLTKTGEQKVNIQVVYTGKFLTCDSTQNQNIIGNKDSALVSETFTLINYGGDKVAFKASNGKFVCADQKKGVVLSADRNEAHEWETFTMEKLDNNNVAFKASNNKYVCCDQNLKFRLIANRDSKGEWETFKIINK